MAFQYQKSNTDMLFRLRTVETEHFAHYEHGNSHFVPDYLTRGHCVRTDDAGLTREYEFK